MLATTSSRCGAGSAGGGGGGGAGGGGGGGGGGPVAVAVQVKPPSVRWRWRCAQKYDFRPFDRPAGAVLAGAAPGCQGWRHWLPPLTLSLTLPVTRCDFLGDFAPSVTFFANHVIRDAVRNGVRNAVASR